MRFGVREICNVVFKAKTERVIGSKKFAKGAPVLFFDSLKTSTMEQAVTPVYAQGGRGNARLVSWDGEKTLTFTMEDALISELGLAILAGAHLFETGKNDEASENTPGQYNTLIVHVSETVQVKVDSKIKLSKVPSQNEAVKTMYVFKLDNETGEIADNGTAIPSDGNQEINVAKAKIGETYLVDYYTEKKEGAIQIDIEPETFGGNFYIEADTLFRDTDGKDHAAQFTIPNGKIQSNFTLTMASSGDPSTFTFTVDAFPGYVNGDLTKKVLATIQIVEEDALTGVNDAAGDDDAVITQTPNT